MDIDLLEKKAFGDIHDLKNDMALLSGCVDRLGEPAAERAAGGDISDRAEIVDEFIRQFNTFVDKYEESVNDKIRLFIAEIKNIVIARKAELIMAVSGVDVSETGRLLVSDVNCKLKNADCMYGEKDTVLEVLSEAFLNAEIHMERFIPVKYLSYDASKDYRILKQEGNIYTKEI